jgi:hypothetical protein
MPKLCWLTNIYINLWSLLQQVRATPPQMVFSHNGGGEFVTRPIITCCLLCCICLMASARLNAAYPHDLQRMSFTDLSM